tara:strand:- start:99 stop:395 length:297 start_codon:yes stop_codon:yes gene_type:complete
MALKPFGECNKKVSTEASTCPSCGVPNPTVKNKKIKGLSIELDKHTTKLSDLDELDGVIEDFKKETDGRYKVNVNLDLMKGSLDITRVRKPYLKLIKK